MVLYAGTIFLSAFLLFLVQPVIAKQILPWFGGAAAVWAICLVFFQSVLLFGYAYADWTTRHLAPRRQVWLHLGLIALSLLTLPIIPEARWKPGADAEPTLLILGLLAATIGLPYFLLSTTSPLVQVWFWQRYRHAVPYRLFALSNLASLLGLLSYPVLIEPFLPLAVQSIGWSIGYGAFAALCGATALASTRGAQAMPSTAAMADPAVSPPSPGDRVLWIALSAMGSCLLLAVTNHLTQNIASIPFLWVVPLSIYLITFILCFDHPRWYRRDVFLPATAMLLPAMAWYSDSLDLWTAAPLYAAGPLRLLHVLPWRAHAPEARPAAPHHLLPDGCAGRSGGVAAGRYRGAQPAFRLFRARASRSLRARCCSWCVQSRMRWWVVSGSVVVVVATTTLVGINIKEYRANTRVMVRNFYGVVRTRDFPQPVPFRAMYHGAINHGGQLLDPPLRTRAEQLFRAHQWIWANVCEPPGGAAARRA